MFIQEEWTQEELYKNKRLFEKKGIEVVLVDTILEPIEYMETVRYNPFELSKYKKGTVFVFYCYSGASTRARLPFYKSKFPDYVCISLKGGKAYWRPNFKYEDYDENL